MLLLATAVYDLPTGRFTVSLCFAVNSARIAVGRSTAPAAAIWNSLPDELRNSEDLIVLNGSLKQFCLAATVL